MPAGAAAGIPGVAGKPAAVGIGEELEAPALDKQGAGLAGELAGLLPQFRKIRKNAQSLPVRGRNRCKNVETFLHLTGPNLFTLSHTV